MTNCTTKIDFRTWFKENLGEYAKDIANHGADAGYPEITYTSDTVKIFDEYDAEIWEMAVEDADEFGYKNVAEMISKFIRTDMLVTVDGFKNLMIWYACEKIAQELIFD